MDFVDEDGVLDEIGLSKCLVSFGGLPSSQVGGQHAARSAPGGAGSERSDSEEDDEVRAVGNSMNDTIHVGRCTVCSITVQENCAHLKAVLPSAPVQCS